MRTTFVLIVLSSTVAIFNVVAHGADPRVFPDTTWQTIAPQRLGFDADKLDHLAEAMGGGGSDHFTRFGAGIYGFNWWFNAAGQLHPQALTWPDVPPDTFMSIGFGGNCAAIVPSLDAVLVAAQANWGEFEAGKSDSQMNRILARFVDTVKPGGH